MPFLQIDDAAGNVDQCFHRNFEQLVTRIGFEDVLQCFFFVAAGQISGTGKHLPQFAAYNRDVVRAAVVDIGGIQTEKAMFSDYLALTVDTLDAHIIEVAGTMNIGARVGLGQDQPFAVMCQFADFCRQGGKTFRLLLAFLLPQDAQAAACHHF